MARVVLPAQRSSASPLPVPRPGPPRAAAIPDHYFDEIDAMARARIASNAAPLRGASFLLDQIDTEAAFIDSFGPPHAATPSADRQESALAGALNTWGGRSRDAAQVIADPRTEPTSPLLRPLPPLPIEIEEAAPDARACAESSARAQVEHARARLQQARCAARADAEQQQELLALKADQVLQKREQDWQFKQEREHRAREDYERVGKEKLQQQAEYEAAQESELADRALKDALEAQQAIQWTQEGNETIAAEEALHLSAFREARQRAHEETDDWRAGQAVQDAKQQQVISQANRISPPTERNLRAWEQAEARHRQLAKERSMEISKQRVRVSATITSSRSAKSSNACNAETETVRLVLSQIGIS